MGAPTWSAEIDWNGDGDFADTREVVTSRVLDGAGISVSYGRENARTTSPTGSGEATLELNNQSRDYSPDNAGGPLYGHLGPGKAVRLRCTHNATTYDVFRGVINGYDVVVEPPDRRVRLSLVDVMAQLQAAKVSTGLYPALRTDEAIAVLLDAAGWPAAARDLDTGATWVRWWWAEGTTALEAIQALVASEGPGALMTVDGSGNFVFRSRHHRLLRAASTTSQATFRSSGSDPRFSALSYDAGWQDVVNVVDFDVEVREPGDFGVVWSSTDTVAIADGETVLLSAQPSDPVTGAVTPAAGVDYTGTGTVTTSLLRTSGQTITIAIRATGGPAVLTSLQLRAVPVPVARTVRISAEDGASIATYGRRTWSGDAPWAGVYDAKAIADLLLASRAQRLPTVVIVMRGGNDSRLVQQLSRDLSDRVRIVNADTGLDDEFWIGRIEHEVGLAGRYLETKFFCEQVPTVPADVMILGTGVLGTNTLGGTGLDDPDDVLVLGTSQLGAGRLGT